ncbi:unnamed protein product [Candidula unifasciata]|uniref:Uncharacterized protein n=1 Tax=Candidula unifasciata TaxID=100452 RepID=A0A8S3YQX4_9EUPU|nr:unnamed protein product [Candidula unifasciata]
MYLYSSLVLFAFFVLYDTQLAVEKRTQGKMDFVWHCVTLFLDGFHIFKLILILLANRKPSLTSA